jgi:hypothetical protein
MPQFDFRAFVCLLNSENTRISIGNGSVIAHLIDDTNTHLRIRGSRCFPRNPETERSQNEETSEVGEETQSHIQKTGSRIADDPSTANPVRVQLASCARISEVDQKDLLRI